MDFESVPKCRHLSVLLSYLNLVFNESMLVDNS